MAAEMEGGGGDDGGAYSFLKVTTFHFVMVFKKSAHLREPEQGWRWSFEVELAGGGGRTRRVGWGMDRKIGKVAMGVCRG